MRSMRKLILLAAVGFVTALAADPALAQFAGGGADAPFQQGMSTVLNWAFIAGVASPCSASCSPASPCSCAT